jgi:hypothetical protein
MPARRATPGTKQLNLEVDESVFVELNAFSQRLGLTKRQVVEKALRRHMDHPPPTVPDPPLPACEPDVVPAPKAKRERKGA